ncbi:MopE-related protein [Runella limosa]|uniref:MopE-related protein n=1 Tax=Runella limosa TaxID=370978 RepID=UPI0003FBB93C|nr:MopE-related protein [Runella limosa]
MKNFLPILCPFSNSWTNTLPLRADWEKAILQIQISTNSLISPSSKTAPQIFRSIFTCIFILLATGAQATVYYVKTDGSDANTGLSWAQAYLTLQKAIEVSVSGDEIWVKAGTYLPTKDPSGNASPTDPRDKTFYLKNGVKIYGGFDGLETMISERDWVANATILSGDFNGDDVGFTNNTENAYHVVITVSDANTTQLDGFTLKGGNANGGAGSFIIVEGTSIVRGYGGGLHNYGAATLVQNCTFTNNSTAGSGGGMYSNSAIGNQVTNCLFTSNAANNGGGAFNNQSSPTFTNCTFSSNTAMSSGGGMRNENNTVVVVTGCVFEGNSCGSSNGGGFYIGTSSTSATLTNCLFMGNAAGGTGGGLYNSSTTMTLTNCTVSGNKASGSGGGVTFLAINPTVTNCLIWNNRGSNTTGSATANMSTGSSTPVITYSLIQNNNPSGTGNLNGIPNAANSNYPDFDTPLDPATAPSTAGDFHIGDCSPAANNGTNTGAPATDLFGNARPFATTTDMGVHELQSTSIAPTTANAGTDQIVSVTSATMTANAPTIGTGAWSLVSGSGTITTPGSPSTTITNLGVGANIFRWTISNATCTASTDDIQLTYTPSVSLTCPTNTAVGTCQTQSAVDLAFTNWLATASGSGGCDGVLTNDSSGAPLACGGSKTVTFTYTSTCAPFTTTCQATFTVNATPSPTPVFANCTNNTVNLGCNPSNLPSCSSIAAGSFGGAVSASNSCGSVPVTCTAGAIDINGCNRTQVFTFEATACGQTVTCTRTFTWTVVTPPSFNGTCGNGVINLGCNPLTLPACDPNVTASNQCGPISVTCNVGAITMNGCNRSQTLTYVANAPGCGTFSTCIKIYNWQIATAPVFDNCDNTIDLGCNPTTLPTCSNVHTAPFGGAITASSECGNVSVSCVAGTVTSNGCNRSQLFTFTATACGLTTTCTRTFTWSEEPIATLTCPASTTVAAGQTQAAVNAAFSTWLATASFSGGCGAVLTNNNTGAPSACGGSTTVTFTLDLSCQADQTCQRTFTVTTPSNPVWYVDGSAASGGSGKSWACAFQNLQDAIDVASSGQEVWVKAGTYLPTKDPFGNILPTDSRDKTFYLKNGVKIYGGFVGTETLLSQRNWITNSTILSGDIGTSGNNSDNAYHVVLSVSDASTTVLDGFKVEKGNANGSSNITVESVNIDRNSGGGIYNSNSSPQLSNCIISGNDCSSNGGGIANFSGSNATLTNCLIAGNRSLQYGGGVRNNESNPSFINCVISGNRSINLLGGGMMNDQSNCIIQNCVIWNNQDNNGLGSASSSITNFTSTPVITYSLIQNQTPSGTGNLNGIPNATNSNYPNFITLLDPATAPSTAGDFHITNCSPVLNRGTNTGAPATDLFGNARPFGTMVDMGVHELQSAAAGLTITCPVNQTGTAPYTLADFTGITSTSGGCGTVSITQNPSVGTSLGVGNHTITMTATDANGTTATCTFTVTVNCSALTTAAPTGSATQTFCSGATISDLVATGTALKWYDAATNGNLLATNTLLTNGTIYYASQMLNSCESVNRLAVTVTANTAPVLTYSNASVNFGNATTVSPTTGPSDNGSISGIIVQSVSPTTAPATLTVDNVTGVVTVPNNVPAGTYTVTVRAADNCNTTTDASFTLTVQSADYTISTTDGDIIIRDISGNSETLDVVQNGSNIQFNVTGRTYSLNGGAIVNFPAIVALTGANSITLNASAGNDIINVGGFSSANLLPSLTINGGIGDDQVNFNGDITFATDANLDVDLQNDNATPGTDQVSFTNSANLVLSGTGAAVIKVSRNIVFSNGTASLETTNGNLTLEANQQATASTGNFIGVSVNGATVRVNGTGTLSVKGKSGTDSAINQFGVVAQNGGLISGGTSGTATIEGSAGAGSANGNIGVYVAGTNARITSLGGNVSVTGWGGSAGASSTCRGVAVGTNGTISAGGSGNVSVTGTGGAGSGNFNVGVYVAGNTSTMIMSGGGNVTVTGTGGSSSSGNNNYGVWQESGGTITAGGNGSVMVQGTGGASTGNNNIGIYLSNTGTQITSGGGDITIIGIEGGGSSGFGINHQSPATITTAINGGNITLIANSMSLAGTVSTQVPGGSTTLRPYTNNVAINLGSTTNTTGGPLGLSDTELDQITTGTLVIGHANSGNITVSSAITRPASTNVQLISGGDVLISGGGFNTGGGTMSLSSVAVKPTFDGTDVTASTLSFASNLSIVINGATLGDGTVSTYTQLKITGEADLSGVNLLLTGTYVPVGGNTFTIVDNDGSDAIVGTFTGLLEGATIPNFRGSGLTATITYLGGSGNDVVITVINNVVCYADTDNDGFGDPNNSMTFIGSCGLGYVSNNTDCDDNDALEKPGQVWYADLDNDGYSSGATLTQCLRPTNYKAASELISTTVDCNDANAAIKPGATEVCDGVDNDCDGSVDEGVLTTYYADADNDGFGNASVSQQACSQPTGYVSNNTDCDDNDALEKPGQVWYADLDNDGYSSGATLTQCLRPTNYKAASELTSTTGDCNDANAAIKPGATEVCDGVDNDCDGLVDEGVLTTYYADSDNDGFGNASVSQQACSQPTGYVSNNTDCDDNDALEKPGQVWYADLDNDGYSSGATLTQCLRPTNYKVASELTSTIGDCNDANAAIKPGATEVCDGVDNDCDGSVDEGGLTTYYADSDNDGFGNASVSQQACSQPTGYVSNNTDCDDSDALEKPGQVWYADLDNDGYSSGATLTQCLRPTNYKAASELTSTTGDCNDNNAAIKPGATEVCDGVDNDCDGSVDEGGLTTYYADADNDGFGNASVSQQACSQPTGYVSNNTDCDDNDALEKPGQVWYADLDNDGYSSGTTMTQCLRPTNYKAASELISTTGDCNDANAAIKPGATEVCDGVDNDCDGLVDEGGLTTYYADADNDGFGNASVSQQACSQPTGYVSNNTDCDDNDALEKPGQVWYADLDNDGYSSGATLTQCLRPTNYKVASELTSTIGDCNDANAAIKPGATEVCDGVDNDCDGLVDEGGLTTYYADADNDGFGNASVSQQACSAPAGYVTDNTDCDDNDALEKPIQVWYKDSDNDGYAETGAATMTQCLRPLGYKAASELTSTTGDCNDANAAIKPGATEVCDGVDNDCDGLVDEGVLTTYYADSDNDGFGNASVSQQACSQPTGYVSNNTDCDDSDALEKPGQVWYADLDNDGYSSGATLTQCLRPTNYKAASELTSTTGDCNDNNAAIINSLSATISYAGTPFCKTLTSAVVTLTGSSGGTFSSTSGLSIDGTTGAINPSTSTAGTYTVTYSIASSGGCAGVNATTVVAIQGKPTITLNTLQQTLNEGNNPVLCDTDANPVNSLQFNVSGLCVVGSPVWRVQVGSGAWSAWSATAPVSQPSNNQPHRYQAACDANCASTYSGVIELTINNRASIPQNVSLVVDGVTVAVGETKEVCSLVTIPLTFNANCAAGEIVLYSVDGGEYSSGVPTGLVDNQFHNYRVRCRKSDGTPSCVESESGVMRLKLVTIPTAPTVSLSSTSSCDATASFSGQSTCGSLRTVWYNATTNVALPNLPSTVPSATTSYYARCQTENGCVSEKSNVVTFTLTPTQVAPVITASQEIVCTGTTVTVSANCPAGSQTFWNTGVTAPSFQVAFNNVTKQTYWAKCLFEGGCQSSESVRKDIYWNAFVLTLINVGETKSAVKPANDKSLWSSQFITRDGGPELEQSTQVNPTLFYVENANKIAPRYWTINVEACGLSTDGSLTFDMLATPEMGVIRSFNTHENNAPYFMYANREGWTELYAQNHPAYGFYQDNGAGGNVYDAGLPKGLYKLGIRYWDMKGWGSIYPSTRQPQGNVLAYQEYWFRIQSKDGVGVGAAREMATNLSSRRDLNPNSFATVLPNPVTNILRLQVQDSKGQAVQTTLTDASGREVLRRQFVPETNTHQEEFGVSELPTGMYFLKVSTSEKQTTLKVVKVGQ